MAFKTVFCLIFIPWLSVVMCVLTEKCWVGSHLFENMRMIFFMLIMWRCWTKQTFAWQMQKSTLACFALITTCSVSASSQHVLQLHDGVQVRSPFTRQLHVPALQLCNFSLPPQLWPCWHHINNCNALYETQTIDVAPACHAFLALSSWPVTWCTRQCWLKCSILSFCNCRFSQHPCSWFHLLPPLCSNNWALFASLSTHNFIVSLCGLGDRVKMKGESSFNKRVLAVWQQCCDIPKNILHNDVLSIWLCSPHCCSDLQRTCAPLLGWHVVNNCHVRSCFPELKR